MGETNLVVITSAIQCLTCNSCFSPDIRFLQLMRSVLTTIEKIPNYYIVVLDTGTMTDIQKEILSKYVNMLVSFDASKLQKNGGELLMTYLFFASDRFKALLPKCATVSKLSGRYFLTERFDFNKFDRTKNIIRYRVTDRCPPYFDTRYFRIPVARFEKFWNHYVAFFNDRTRNFDTCSVENLYYTDKFFEIEDCEYDTHIGVGGYFACTGKYQED